jgi:hypothetical protein
LRAKARERVDMAGETHLLRAAVLMVATCAQNSSMANVTALQVPGVRRAVPGRTREEHRSADADVRPSCPRRTRDPRGQGSRRSPQHLGADRRKSARRRPRDPPLSYVAGPRVDMADETQLLGATAWVASCAPKPSMANTTATQTHPRQRRTVPVAPETLRHAP